MGRIATDYYVDNPERRLAALTRRVAALERALGRTGAALGPGEGTTDALPFGELPSAADIPSLFVLVPETGKLYRIEGLEAGGSPRIRLAYVGRVREAV